MTGITQHVLNKELNMTVALIKLLHVVTCLIKFSQNELDSGNHNHLK